jgi:two-component system response regulator HydG
VLENREIKRVGSPDAIQIEIRVIAATNRNLREMVAAGTFRDDLYYRLNVGAIQLPPLRERTEDIEPLLQHLVETFSTKFGKSVTGVDPKAMDVLLRAPWPGNIRELANVIERAMVMAKGTTIQVEHLPAHIVSPPVGAAAATPATPPLGDDGAAPPDPSDLSLEAAEREQIRRALEVASGRRVAAARLLGLSRRTLYRKLDKYGIH